jgi:hypothetical protein
MWLGSQWPGVVAMKSCETFTSQQGQELLSMEAEESTAMGAVPRQRLMNT